MMVTAGLSMLSLMATISVILEVRDPNQNVPKIATIVYEFSPAIFMAVLFGILEYRKQTTRSTKRLMHAFAHYLEPTLANYYVSAYIIFGVFMAPVYLITDTPALAVNVFFIALTYLSVPVLNFFRAYESYRFQYTLPDALRAENAYSGSAISHHSGVNSDRLSEISYQPEEISSDSSIEQIQENSDNMLEIFRL